MLVIVWGLSCDWWEAQQKFSCTYEYVRAGVSAEAMNSQGHRISNYNKYMHGLIKEGYFRTKNIENLETWLDMQKILTISNLLSVT